MMRFSAPPGRLARRAAIALCLAGGPAMAGTVSGTIDGQTLELELDCGGWSEGGYPELRSADGAFDATLFAGDARLAVTWRTEAKRYQLLFGEVAFEPVVSVSSTFTDSDSGADYAADLVLDCSG